jgi:hypothetical protein
MSSAAEAERGGLYLNAKESVPLRNTLIELSHPQPPDGTPIRTDNSTADDHESHRQTKKIKKYGYAILVACRSRGTKPISNLLGDGQC